MSRNTDMQLMARLMRLPAAMRAKMTAGEFAADPRLPRGGMPGSPSDPRVRPEVPPFRHPDGGAAQAMPREFPDGGDGAQVMPREFPGGCGAARTMPRGFPGGGPRGPFGPEQGRPGGFGHGPEHGMHGRGPMRPPFSRERILGLLLENENGLRQGAIAGSLGVNPSSASEFIDRLIADGYVCRQVDPSDKRATIVRLTELGQARACELQDEESARLDRLFGHLTEQEKLDLIRLIDKLLGEPNRPRPDNVRKV